MEHVDVDGEVKGGGTFKDTSSASITGNGFGFILFGGFSLPVSPLSSSLLVSQGESSSNDDQSLLFVSDDSLFRKSINDISGSGTFFVLIAVVMTEHVNKKRYTVT